MMKHTPRKVSRRTFLKTGAVAAAVMACAGALSACWVPVDGSNGDIVVTKKTETIDGVTYTMDVSLVDGPHFSLTVSGEGAPTLRRTTRTSSKCRFTTRPQANTTARI